MGGMAKPFSDTPGPKYVLSQKRAFSFDQADVIADGATRHHRKSQGSISVSAQMTQGGCGDHLWGSANTCTS